MSTGEYVWYATHSTTTCCAGYPWLGSDDAASLDDRDHEGGRIVATMRLVRRGELHFNEDGDPFVGRADIASLIAALAGGPDISLEGTLTIEFEIEPVNDTGFSGTLSGAFGGPVQKARAPRAQIS